MSDALTPPRAEGMARFLIALLMLLAPAVYVAKIALGGSTHEPWRPVPRRAQVVLLTFGRWPMVDALPPGDAFDRVRSRSVDVGPVFTASEDPGAAAVSLLTGRYAVHHGVRDEGSALPEGTWTWPLAAREAGSATAVFSQAPFAGRHRIAGFDTVVEDPALATDELADRAAAFLIEHQEERKFLWLHVERPGPAGSAVADLLDRLEAAFDEIDQRSEVLMIVTALEGPKQLEDELGLRVPLFVELPTALKARLTPKTHLSHVDLAGTFVRFLDQELPSVAGGQVPFQSRPKLVETALGGQVALDWVWVEGSFGHVLRIPPVPPAREGVRIEVPDTDSGAEPKFEVRRLLELHTGPDGSPVTSEQELGPVRERYLEIRREVLSGATPADRVQDP